MHAPLQDSVVCIGRQMSSTMNRSALRKAGSRPWLPRRPLPTERNSAAVVASLARGTVAVQPTDLSSRTPSSQLARAAHAGVCSSASASLDVAGVCSRCPTSQHLQARHGRAFRPALRTCRLEPWRQAQRSLSPAIQTHAPLRRHSRAPTLQSGSARLTRSSHHARSFRCGRRQSCLQASRLCRAAWCWSASVMGDTKLAWSRGATSSSTALTLTRRTLPCADYAPCAWSLLLQPTRGWKCASSTSEPLSSTGSWRRRSTSAPQLARRASPARAVFCASAVRCTVFAKLVARGTSVLRQNSWPRGSRSHLLTHRYGFCAARPGRSSRCSTSMTRGRAHRC